MPYIVGRVVDRFTGSGLPATINIGSVFTTADGSGRFSVFVSQGNYHITIYYAGYDTVSTSAYVEFDTDIGDVGMSPIFSAL